MRRWAPPLVSNFGVGVYREHSPNEFFFRHAEQIQQIGSVFQLARWMVVNEVSGAAPAPHDAGDDLMNAWVDTAYFYQKGDFDVFQVS